MTWHTIAVACEKAEGPDKQIDMDIALLAGDVRPKGLLFGDWYSDIDEKWSPPAYTADLNAIVALIEKLGLYYRISKNTPAEASVYGKAYWATCGNPGEQESADSNHRAIALCTALARAMAVKGGEDA